MTRKEQIIKLKYEHPEWDAWRISQETQIPFSNVDYHLNPKRQARAKLYAAQSRKRHPLKEKLYCFARMGNGKKRQHTTTISIKTVVDKIGQNPKCYLTGKPLDLTDSQSFSFDHRTPLSKGGTNTIDNLEICTIEANVSKNGFSLPEFLDFCSTVLRNHGYKVTHK